MAIFTIGDLHLSLGTAKPMDIFSGWHNYVNRLESAWQQCVGKDDTVVLVGDISWEMRIDKCDKDFAFINALPGHKIIIKGNHDYWWTTKSKMDLYLLEKCYDTISILNNNSFSVQNYSICGTRSWMFDAGQERDEKLINRELGRLRASLESAGNNEKLVFLHYPPICNTDTADGVISLMHEFGVKHCFYGHLHSASIKNAVEGEHDGINYKLVSADALNFCPYKINF